MKYVFRHGRLVPKDDVRYSGVTRGPFVISDSMPLVEQVDGCFYDSKSKFRAVGRSLGLVEVGNERIKPKKRMTWDRAAQEVRVKAIRNALEKVKAGYGR